MILKHAWKLAWIWVSFHWPIRVEGIMILEAKAVTRKVTHLYGAVVVNDG